MITAKFKNFFLDRAHIIERIGAAKVKVLMKSGGRIRLTAQRSMRYRKKPSPAGQPPSAHRERGALLRKLLFFIYDTQADSVVVGPVAAKKAEAPRLNEFGGTRIALGTHFVKTGRGKGKGFLIKKGQHLTYPKRAFMEPALKKEEPRLPKEWSGSVVGP